MACCNFGFSYYADRSNQNRGVTAPLAATLFVLANKKDAKNGLLIARNVRLFQERYSCTLVATGSAGLVSGALMHGAWPLLVITSSNAP